MVLRRPEPLIYGIALTDRCNLACRGCHVSNTGRRDMTWDQLVAAMQNAWARGFRELYFSGGEPTLWRAADYTLADAIVEAKRIGFFHTPYYGRDELFLTTEERAPIIDRLLGCIRAGLPVINSRAGLLALKSGDWPRRFPVASVIDVDGESVCCRASDEVCADCGYAACTELTEFQRLRPSALLGMTRYW